MKNKINKSNQKDLKENVASKSDSFCEDTASYEVACFKDLKNIFANIKIKCKIETFMGCN
jgi:hypothetical protein